MMSSEQEGRKAGVEAGEGGDAPVEDIMCVHTGPGEEAWALLTTLTCGAHLYRPDFRRQDESNLKPNLAWRAGPFSRIIFQCFI